MNIFRCSVFLLRITALASISCTALAASIEGLQAAGALEVRSFITTQSPVVPGQNVKLVLETATNTWFSGGTRITIPEVPGLVILQNEKFASNASESRRGETWVVQRWTLDIFPQRSGTFSIPPVDLHVSVNADGNVEGILQAPATSLEVTLPKSLSAIKTWIAAPQFSVQQTFDKPLEALAVGDAFEQHVEFEASDTMAMMLPAYVAQSKPGLAAYPSPPVLENNINRGQNTARRSVRISYVVETPGVYEIAAKDYYWWDTKTGELRVLTLPVSSVLAGGALIEEEEQSAGEASIEFSTVQSGLLGSLSILLIFALWFRVKLQSLGTRFFTHLRQTLAVLRKPALPQKLNPENNAEL